MDDKVANVDLVLQLHTIYKLSLTPALRDWICHAVCQTQTLTTPTDVIVDKSMVMLMSLEAFGGFSVT